MRIIPLIFTVALVWALNHRWGATPPFGMLFSPQHGFWVHAEPVGSAVDDHLVFSELKGKAEVWFDDRMVAHVFAENEADAYFIQGYIHARNRLWQMELQTHAAGGRLSEILGPKLLGYDRLKRRQGMVYGAEQMVKAIEKDPVVKMEADSYTAGINAYIRELRRRNYPLEYKLLGYSPEPWTNIKTALLVKYMSADLASTADDMPYTNARNHFSKEDFDQLYPDFSDVIAPIIPKGTVYPAPARRAVSPPDSIVKAEFSYGTERNDRDKGSNNWAVAGSKTKNGFPILCNDPHLELSLPSLFYEMQIKTPTMNVYGVSLPGAPGIIIGFNDNMSWGLTNGYVDVLDYYKMEFRNGKKEYLFNGQYRPAELRVEEIKIKGEPVFRDTVAYTVWGPVLYDESFTDPRFKGFLAMRWTAHDESNELHTIHLLNRARNYEEYEEALKYWNCPGQNFVYAGKKDGIAIWHNGRHPLRWKDQGKFVMPGSDSTYAWQGFVPQSENPHIHNPAEGFVSSANQQATDSTYPYHLFGYYDLYRGMRIQERLGEMSGVTPEDMMRLQNDNKNRLAEAAMPFLSNFVVVNTLTGKQQEYWRMMFAWDGVAGPDSKAATIFNLWWSDLEDNIWGDELPLNDSSIAYVQPEENTLLYWLMRDSSMHFIDNIHTPVRETLSDQVTASFRAAADTAAALDARGELTLGKFRGTDIRHLSRSIPAFSRMHLNTGGGRHIVNATKKTTGPSWRMVVELGPETKAWGIFPGGQSGNPGSRYYDNMIDDWLAGKYYALKVMDQKKPEGIRGRIVFERGGE